MARTSFLMAANFFSQTKPLLLRNEMANFLAWFFLHHLPQSNGQTFIYNRSSLQSLDSVCLKLKQLKGLTTHSSDYLILHDLDFFIMSGTGAISVVQWWMNLLHKPLSPSDNSAAFWSGVQESSLWPSVFPPAVWSANDISRMTFVLPKSSAHADPVCTLHIDVRCRLQFS